MKYLKYFVALFIMAGALNAMTREEFESAMAGAPVSTQQQVQSAAGASMREEVQSEQHSGIVTDEEAAEAAHHLSVIIPDLTRILSNHKKLRVLVPRNVYLIDAGQRTFQDLKNQFNHLIKKVLKTYLDQKTIGSMIHEYDYSILCRHAQFQMTALQFYHKIHNAPNPSERRRVISDLRAYQSAASDTHINLPALGISISDILAYDNERQKSGF